MLTIPTSDMLDTLSCGDFVMVRPEYNFGLMIGAVRDIQLLGHPGEACDAPDVYVCIKGNYHVAYEKELAALYDYDHKDKYFENVCFKPVHLIKINLEYLTDDILARLYRSRRTAQGFYNLINTESHMPHVCPFCGSSELVYEPEDEKHYLYPWKCRSCGTSGTEKYTLVFDGHTGLCLPKEIEEEDNNDY